MQVVRVYGLATVLLQSESVPGALDASARESLIPRCMQHWYSDVGVLLDFCVSF